MTEQFPDEPPIVPIQLPDVSGLTQQAASEYRRELIHALRNPGLEFEPVGEQGELDHSAYWEQVKNLDALLASYPVPREEKVYGRETSPDCP